MLEVDLLVVGGGPAGTAAAITAARRGVRTALFEARLFPREVPGETLPPGVEPLLVQLGVWDGVGDAGFHRHAGIWVERAGRAEFQPYGEDEDGPWLGLQAVRSAFDAILLDGARRAGVCILQPDRPRRPVWSDGRWALDSRAGPVRARWLVDAAGSGHWLARRLGLPVWPHSAPRYCSWGETRDFSLPDAVNPFLRMTGSGWTWTAPLGDGRAATARSCHAPSLAGPRPSRDVTWRRCDRVAGEGWFIAGDAAGVLDPLSGKGVLRALMSGVHAGWLVDRLLRDEIAGPQAAETYEAWWSGVFRRDLDQLEAMDGVPA